MVYYSYIMPSKHTKFYSLLLIAIDFAILAAVFFAAYYIRTQLDQRDLLYPVYKWDYIRGFLAVAPVWIFIFANLGLYSPGVYNRRLVEWARIALGSFFGVLLVFVLVLATSFDIFNVRVLMWFVVV